MSRRVRQATAPAKRIVAAAITVLALAACSSSASGPDGGDGGAAERGALPSPELQRPPPANSLPPELFPPK